MLVPTFNRMCMIQNTSSGKCLDLAATSKNLVGIGPQLDCGNYRIQSVMIKPTSNEYKPIQFYPSNLCMDARFP